MFCFQFGSDPIDCYSNQKRISEAAWSEEISGVSRAVSPWSFFAQNSSTREQGFHVFFLSVDLYFCSSHMYYKKTDFY